MKQPRVIVCDSDGWVAKQLRELAAENRWLVRASRATDTALSLARERCPAVLLVQFEPGSDKPAPLMLIADVHRHAPDVPIIAVADTKLADPERVAWTAALFDLGARFVLFPPLTKSVLEDTVSALMTATIRRVMGEETPVPTPPSVTHTPVLDLAEEGEES